MTIYKFCSVGTVLIFRFSPGFGTDASVPAVSRYRFWYLGSGSYFSIPGFRYKVFSFSVSVFRFSAPFQLQIKRNLKIWFNNLNRLEPKLLKIFGTKIKKVAVLSVFSVLDQH